MNKFPRIDERNLLTDFGLAARDISMMIEYQGKAEAEAWARKSIRLYLNCTNLYDTDALLTAFGL